jgi:conjugal transfer pilus assembly protein TraD
MPSASNSPTPNPPDQLEPVEQAVHWLLSTTGHVVLGLILAYFTARVLRGRHLHWSWAACGAVCVMLGFRALGDAAVTLGVTAIGAAFHSRRWHHEDLDAGADLAEIAASRTGPLDALRTVIQRASARRGAVGVDGWWRGGELIIARDEDGRDVSIPLGGPTGGTHTLVVGATRSGKTVTMTWMAVRAIEHGMGAIVVDPKGDRDLREEIYRAAQAAGRRFVEWTPQGPSIYNPYARGSETEIADKVLSGEHYTEPHYLRQAQRYLGHVVRMLRKADHEVSLQGIVDHLDPAQMDLLVRGLPESEVQRTNDYLDSLTARQRSDLAGVRDRLAIMAESDVGQWLDPQAASAERFELLEVVKERAVVYFNLEADRRPLFTQMLGAAIVQDLQTTVAALQGQPVPLLVAIDEFSAIAPDRIVGLFGRASGAGASLVLGTQELSDLRLPGRERLLDQVMGNLSVLIAHRQVVPDSAELIARLGGTKGTWRTSQSSDGRTTRTRTREGVLEGDEITSLGQGWAAVITLVDGGRVRVAHVLSSKHYR